MKEAWGASGKAREPETGTKTGIRGRNGDHNGDQERVHGRSPPSTIGRYNHGGAVGFRSAVAAAFPPGSA